LGIDWNIKSEPDTVNLVIDGHRCRVHSSAAGRFGKVMAQMPEPVSPFPFDEFGTQQSLEKSTFLNRSPKLV
jgi:hypothetical protein